MTERRASPPARFLRATWRVLVHFHRNRGLLLAGAVAYYTLLSLIPLIVLLLIGLSHLVDQAELLESVRMNLALIVPGRVDDLVDAVEQVLAQRDVITGAGIVVLLVFSSFAFSVLENAMEVIFHHRRDRHSRHFAVSLLLPYIFISFLSVGLLALTGVTGAIHWVDGAMVTAFGRDWALFGASGIVIYLLGFVTLVLIFTSMYMVFPVGRIRFTHALLGGTTAAALWEVMRHVLVWYYSTVSMVQVVYGTFATAVVSLLTLEVGAIIILLGAQVIADYDRRGIDETES